MSPVRIEFCAIVALYSIFCAGVVEGAPRGGASVIAAPILPFTFVENTGQAAADVRFIGLGPEFSAWFEDRSVLLQQGGTTVRIRFSHSSRNRVPRIGRVAATNLTGAHANFIRGSDHGAWRTDLPVYDGVRYPNVWPGIDLTYGSDHGKLKAEYLVAPGAAVEDIELSFSGSAYVNEDGTLRVKGASGEFVEEKPRLYQDLKDKRVEVEGGFRRLPGGTIGFKVTNYDATRPLVIDPTILFSGYFGGSSQTTITAVAIDSQYNTVAAGWTSSIDLPAGGEQKKYAGSVDAFVASFAPNGGPLIYCTYLGGSGDDQALGVALDSARNVYITGWTASTNFPVAQPFQSHLKGTRDAFVTKLSATGNSLIYSTYLGGSSVDTGNAISVDPTGGAAVVGDSTSQDLPVTPGVLQGRNNGAQDAFVAYFSPAGNTLKFLTYLGGSGVEHASSVMVGGAGHVIVAGYTWSNNFPTQSACQPASGGGQDGFVTKLASNGSSMIYSTYIGGSGGSVGAPESVNGVYVDQLGNAFAAGVTSSANFPVTAGAFQTVFGGETDGFIVHLAPLGSLVEATFLGGALSDTITGIAQDFHANPYVTGSTSSLDFPVERPFQNVNAGTIDAFAVKMNTTLSNLTFGTYLGGSANDSGNAIAVDAETSMVIAGPTSSGNFPTAGGLKTYLPATLSSFVTKIAPNFTLGAAYGASGQLEFTADAWHVTSFTASTFYGNATDLPISGDWTGAGTKTIGIFRNGTWFLDTNGNGVLDASDKVVQFGQAGDIPVVGDWRGTGRIALGLYRQGSFILDLSGHLSGVPTGLSDATFPFGLPADIPVVSDWNNTGTSKVGVFRNGQWLVDYNGDQVFNGLDRTYIYGQAGDIPVLGDWDSSGNPAKIGIYRAGLWVLDYDGDNAWTVPYVNEMVLSFGFAGYSPLIF
jgi:hypothetical protein